MAHKTKAAPHGRQSHHTKRHQITRPAAGGQNLRELHNRNSVLMNFSKALSSASVEGNGTYGKNSYVKGQISTLYSQRNFIQDFALARIGGLKLNHELSVTQNLGNAPVKVGFPHLWGKPLKGCAPRNGGSRTSKVVARKGVNPRVQNCTLLVNQYLKHTTKSGEARYPDIGYQLFGSMPRCCNSLRIIRLIQAASDSSPSCCWACSISSRNSGSSLNWNGGLPRLSFLCVDTSITPDVMCLCVITHYIHVLQIATPRSAGTLPRRLTKPLYEVTIMAEIQHTQTHPKFTWRFLALNRHDKQAKPCRLSVEAATEREARRILAPHFILSLAARLPVQEVSHA